MGWLRVSLLVQGASASRRRTVGHAPPSRHGQRAGRAALAAGPGPRQPGRHGVSPPPAAPSTRRTERTRRPWYALPPAAPTAGPTASRPLRGAIRHCAGRLHSAIISNASIAVIKESAALLPVLAPGGTALRIRLPPNDTVTCSRPLPAKCGNVATGGLSPHPIGDHLMWSVCGARFP